MIVPGYNVFIHNIDDHNFYVHNGAGGSNRLSPNGAGAHDTEEGSSSETDAAMYDGYEGW